VLVLIGINGYITTHITTIPTVLQRANWLKLRFVSFLVGSHSRFWIH